MAVFRIEKTRDYTVMANHHLRNKALSLKAKGLLSLMLSLPEDWDYTTRGLSCICKDGVDSIRVGMDMSKDYLYRSALLVVCGNAVDETMKNDIAMAARFHKPATTLDGILTVKGQGRRCQNGS